MMRRICIAAVFLALFMGAQPANAESFALIISGSGGEAEYEARFRDWHNRLVRVLTGSLGFETGHVYSLIEELEGAPMPEGAVAVSRDAVIGASEELVGLVTNEDDLFLFIMGHGSYQDRVSKLIMPGPDLTAEGLGLALDKIPARKQVIINAASSSAGFINALSAENRVICSATKSVEERNAPEFMEHFLSALEDGSADQNRDERISVLEVCAQAAALTEAAYSAEKLILAEHALIDDNGDGLGTRLPISDFEGEGASPPERMDGETADAVFLRDYDFPDAAPEDLITAYLDALKAVEKLKREKDSMDEAAYYAELERLLLGAARTNRNIRSYADVDGETEAAPEAAADLESPGGDPESIEGIGNQKATENSEAESEPSEEVAP